MRIGMVCYPTYGGSGVVATELGKALADRGHQVHFVSNSLPARLDVFRENLYFHEVSMVHYPLFEHSPYVLALTGKLVEVVREQKLDLLHVHYAIPHATAAHLAREILAGQGIRVKVITTLHGTDITLVGKDPNYAPVVSFAIQQSDAVTAVSDFLRDETHRYFDCRKKVITVPNFVDLHRFTPSVRPGLRERFCPEGHRLLIHISNFRRVKRIDRVVEWFHRISEQVPSTLLMVGDGPELPRAEQSVREGGLSGKVHFIGRQDPVESLLGVSDLLLLPSETESFGLAALEAMACGVPVMSSDAGGLPELIEDGLGGILVPENGQAQGIERAVALLSDPSRLDQFRQASIRRASNYSLERILPLYEALYRQVLEEDNR
ncbi:MAG: N-acetyl-alpha-D-glucosaminyl L-malate synthase BshA [Bacteroidetes bacterium]|jgi:N-acetyl-alpha-D-glucosaminyl L-malate synthase BshA|nr:N-acetyl-alpha-D-glucosaminyl L-malate synthase BshA [Bacteroidota bacterium]